MTIRVPVGAERHARHPRSVWPLRSSTAVARRASHTFAVLSALPVTIRVPSGLNATLFTWPSVAFQFEQNRPRPASHTFAVLSALPVTMRVPSGLNATLFTSPCGL